MRVFAALGFTMSLPPNLSEDGWDRCVRSRCDANSSHKPADYPARLCHIGYVVAELSTLARWAGTK